MNARPFKRYEDIEDDQLFINAQLVRYSGIASQGHTLLGDDARTWYDKKALIARTSECCDAVCAAHRLRPELTSHHRDVCRGGVCAPRMVPYSTSIR